MKIEIEYSEEKEQTSIIGGTGDNWFDLAILLEAVGVMMGIERQKYTNPKGIKTANELCNYVKTYIDKVGYDYEDVYEKKPIGN